MVKVLFSDIEIQEKVQELASQIKGHYGDEPLLLVGILKGSVVFLSDLLRAIPGDVEIDFMSVSSYGESTESSGVVRLLKDLDVAIEGRHVIIVEDIVDTGLTLKFLIQTLSQRNPRSIEICSLLDKKIRRTKDVEVAFKGFEIEDGFVVGYGIDCAQKYRNLPYIGVIEE